MRENSKLGQPTYLHIGREEWIFASLEKEAYRKNWTKLWFTVLPYPERNRVVVHDIRSSLPFDDDSFDAVYASHVFEHLKPDEGKRFIGELIRTLRPGGTCRVSVPDLERVARGYVESLHLAISEPSDENFCNYDWSVLEVIDQMLRDKPGGRMFEYIERGYFNRDYLRKRFGAVFDQFIDRSQPRELNRRMRHGSRFRKAFSEGPTGLFYALIRKLKLLAWRTDPRKTKEAHLWMYDCLSLRLLMERAGLGEVVKREFNTSAIRGWQSVKFDECSLSGCEFEPSLYLEGRKSECGIGGSASTA